MKIRPLRTGAFPVLLLAALAAACSPDSSKQSSSSAASNVTLTARQKNSIHLYTVAPSQFHKTVSTTGVVDFDNDRATSVLAPFSGPVTRLLVSPGDRVKKGTALALVDSPDFATAVSTYRKAITAAETDRRLADMDQDLLKHQGVSAREAAQAETDAIGAEADRNAALQALAALNADPATLAAIRDGKPMARIESVLRAPIEGTVVEKLITPGQLLQAGTTACFTIADLSRVWVMAQVFGADIDNVHLNDTAAITTGNGGASLTGTVTNIAALVDPNTRSVNVRIAVVNPGDVLKKQMYVRAVITSAQSSTGLLVPVSAVLRDDDNLPFVYVAQPGASFARAHVTLGYRTGDSYDITSGLRVGQQIVTDGGLFLQFMQTQ